MTTRAVLLMAMACAGISGAANAQGLPPYRHRLLGVFDAGGKPLAGVEVSDVRSGITALTTSTGTVSLAFLPDGGSDVRVRQIGFVPVTQFVRIGPADTVPVTVILIESATVLPALERRDTVPSYISPGLREFEERRRGGRGYFITERELRKSDNRAMQNVLRTIPGIGISCAKVFPQDCHVVSGRAQTKFAVVGGQCLVALYVDGIPSMENDINTFRVSDYAAIESYSGSQIPQRYNASGNACGALLFWTRER